MCLLLMCLCPCHGSAANMLRVLLEEWFPRYAHSSRYSLVDGYSVVADSHCCVLYRGRYKINLAFTEGRRWHMNF